MIKKSFLIAFSFFLAVAANAQYANPNIKTVLLHPEKTVMGMPVIEMNSAQKLLLSFDELNGDGRSYKCTFVHCNANWMQSDLETYQYLNGFKEFDITNLDFSRTKYQDYVHYEYLFPNDDVVFLKSGNYLLRVYDENDPDNILLERGFTIVDSRVSFAALYKQPKRSDIRLTHQQVEFTMVCNSVNIINPYQNLNVYVQQNGQPEIVTAPKPKFINGNNFEYKDDDDGLVFEGGNQFRNFDIKSIEYLSEFLNNIYVVNDSVHVFVNTDEKRSFNTFNEVYDINGKYAIKADNKLHSELEGEYVYVHFELKSEFPLKDGDVYLNGSFTRGLFNDYNKMQYDYFKKVYKKTLLVKQGYYDYQYVFMQDKTGSITTQPIEGNHWETKNVYYIYAFYRYPGNNYDDCIGFVAL